MKLIDLVGHKFGRLSVVARVGTIKQPSGQARPTWRCKCDCGAIVVARGMDLRSGNTQSCGCYRKDLGPWNRTHNRSHKGDRAYSVWLSMHKRCSNPNDAMYIYYGARGISVCKRWRKFENFLSDMGDPPINMTIERSNNNGHYSPDNCKWATIHEQTRNRRSNIQITIHGRTQCLKDWCDELHQPYARIHARITALKWPPEIALSTPLQKAFRGSPFLTRLSNM